MQADYLRHESLDECELECECGGSRGPVATVTSVSGLRVCIKLRSLDTGRRAAGAGAEEDQSEPAISDYQCGLGQLRPEPGSTATQHRVTEE